MNINIRKLIENDISEVSALINDTVLEFKNIDFTEDGWKIFVDSNSFENNKYIINTPEYITEYITYIAEDEGKIIGIIKIRNFNTINRFYVKKDYWKFGIGRKLWEIFKKEFINELINKKIIVKSSKYALPIYKKFGFKQIEERKCENGCYFTLLEYKMKNGA